MQNPTPLINQAETELIESNQLFETFRNEWERSTNHLLNDAESVRTMQLVLQYRMDTQSALYQLGKLQQCLLQLLGVEPQHSFELNMERLAFALGSDDLQQILSMLNQLIDSLLRIIAQYQQQQKLELKKSATQLKNLKLHDLLSKTIEKQHSFITKINKITHDLDKIGGTPKPGVVYDYIAALQGPVSRFHQALQNGLVLSTGLYQQMQHKPNFQYHLADTLQKADQALHDFNYHPEQQHLFKPTIEQNNTARLEERASEKRLGHFFNH